MRKIGLGAVAVAATVGVVFAMRGPASGAAVEAPKYKTAAVVAVPLRVVVAATGYVDACFKVDVKSKASGEVVEFPLEPGDRVEVGAPLVTLDPREESRNVKLAEADHASNLAALAASDADRKLSQSRLARDEDLAKKSLVSPEELDAARFGLERAVAAVDLARAAVTRSEVAIELARQRLQDTRILAPIAGILISKAVDRGHIIASGITSISGGTTLATIADMSRVFVYADVDEADVGRVHPGASARITTDAYRDVAFEGRVDRLMPLGVEDQNVTVFRAKIEVVSDNRTLLLPNMTANVQILVAEKASAVVVPSAALREENGKRGVLVVASAGGMGVFREVRRGLTDGNVTEVEGVAVGEIVVTAEEKPEEPKKGFSLFGGGGQKKPATTTSSGTGTTPATATATAKPKS